MAPESQPSPGRALFRREGEYWTIAHAGRLIRLRHSKGLGYLERLLREPGRRFPVLELAPPASLGRRAAAAGPVALERGRVAVTRAIRNALRKVAAHDAALGELLQRSVRTGAACAYQPERGAPCTWER